MASRRCLLIAANLGPCIEKRIHDLFQGTELDMGHSPELGCQIRDIVLLTVRERDAVAGNAQFLADSPQRLNGDSGHPPLKVGDELGCLVNELCELFLGHPAFSLACLTRSPI